MSAWLEISTYTEKKANGVESICFDGLVVYNIAIKCRPVSKAKVSMRYPNQDFNMLSSPNIFTLRQYFFKEVLY